MNTRAKPPTLIEQIQSTATDDLKKALEEKKLSVTHAWHIAKFPPYLQDYVVYELFRKGDKETPVVFSEAAQKSKDVAANAVKGKKTKRTDPTVEAANDYPVDATGKVDMNVKPKGKKAKMVKLPPVTPTEEDTFEASVNSTLDTAA